MLTFTTKEEYLTWRTQWKADYKKLSAEIRDLKFARWFSDSTRGGVKMSEAQTARFNQLATQYSNSRWGFLPNHLLAEFRAKATGMLQERKAAKQQAQAQYLASKTPSTVPA
jgi:hypothetical protein